MSATRNSTISTIKWATKTRNLFCNMDLNVLKAFYHPRSNLLAANWVNTDF